MLFSSPGEGSPCSRCSHSACRLDCLDQELHQQLHPQHRSADFGAAAQTIKTFRSQKLSRNNSSALECRCQTICTIPRGRYYPAWQSLQVEEMLPSAYHLLKGSTAPALVPHSPHHMQEDRSRTHL